MSPIIISYCTTTMGIVCRMALSYYWFPGHPKYLIKYGLLTQVSLQVLYKHTTYDRVHPFRFGPLII